MKPVATTVTLLVVNLILLGYIFLFERHTPDSTTGSEREKWLMNFDRDSVAQVRLRTDAGDAQIVRQADGSWRFLTPFEDRFSPKLMAELLDAAGKLRINDTIVAKEIARGDYDDKYFGFDQNSVGVELFDGEGESLGAVELGGPTPFKSTIYARKQGEIPVHYVWGELREIATLSFDELRDRRLIFAKTDDIWRAKFFPPGLEIWIERRRPDNRWEMKRPLVGARCDQEVVNAVIGLLAKLEVEEFVEDPGVDMATAFDGGYRIVLLKRTPVAEDAKIEIELSKAPSDKDDPFVLAKVTGRAGLFRIDKRVLDDLGMNSNSLRDRTLADFDYNTVSGVRLKQRAIQREGQPPVPDPPEIVLRSVAGAWALFDEDDKAEFSANGREVKELIAAINDEEILNFASDSAVELDLYGLEEPLVEVTVTRQFPDPEAVAEVGKPPKPLVQQDVLMLGVGFLNQPAGEPFAAFKGEHHVYKVSRGFLSSLQRATRISFRSKQLWPRFTAFHLRKITLQDKASEVPLQLDFDYKQNSWKATRGGVDVTGDIERVLLDAYLSFLGTPPRGDYWTVPNRRSDEQLADPELTLVIDLVDPQDDQTPRRITLTASPSQSGLKNFYFARINQGKHIMFLRGETFERMRMPLSRISRRR